MIKKGSKSDDVKVIARTLVDEVEKISSEIKLDWAMDKSPTNEILFMGSPVRAEYRTYKVSKELRKFETLWGIILKECSSEVQVESNEYRDSITTSIARDSFSEEGIQSLKLKHRSSSSSELSRVSFVEIDYDLEEKLEEQKNLEAAIRIASDMKELNQNMNIEMLQQRERLVEVDKEAAEAVVESGKLYYA